jgi:hypothetical protein
MPIGTVLKNIIRMLMRFNDPEIDAIYIATPPDVHKYYALKAAAKYVVLKTIST